MISKNCEHCGGEDCICCEVFLEQQADIEYEREYQADDDYSFEEVDEDDEDC